MKKRLDITVVAVCITIAIAAFAYTASAQNTDASKKATASWEHLAMSHDGADVQGDAQLSSQIVRLGNDGWELVTVSTVVKAGTTVKTVFYFKRPK